MWLPEFYSFDTISPQCNEANKYFLFAYLRGLTIFDSFLWEKESVFDSWYKWRLLSLSSVIHGAEFMQCLMILQRYRFLLVLAFFLCPGGLLHYINLWAPLLIIDADKWTTANSDLLYSKMEFVSVSRDSRLLRYECPHWTDRKVNVYWWERKESCIYIKWSSKVTTDVSQ